MASRKQPATRKAARKQEVLPLHSQPTFAQVARWFLEDWAPEHLRKKTLAARRSLLTRLVAELPERPTSGDIQAWLSGKVRRGELAGSSANLHLRALGAVYTAAQRLQWPLLLVVTAAVKPFPTPRLKPKALADPERDWALCLAACVDDRERAFLSVMRECGLRPGEALALEPRHVDLSRCVLDVAQQRDGSACAAKPLKTDASAGQVQMPPDTVELMRKVLGAHRARARGLQVVGRRGQRGEAAERYLFPYFAVGLVALVERLRAAVPDAFARRKVGLQGGAGLHVFRHTFATDLANRGLSTDELHVLLRHKNPSTTTLYVQSIRGRQMPVGALQRAWAERAAEKARAQVVLPDAARGNTTGVVQANEVRAEEA